MASRSSNQERNRWTVDLLDLQPSDRVLEIGYGPGLALAQAAGRVTSGEIAGMDHSRIMLEQATARNAAAIQAGRMRLSVGGLDDLGGLGGPFDKVYWSMSRCSGKTASVYLPQSGELCVPERFSDNPSASPRRLQA